MAPDRHHRIPRGWLVIPGYLMLEDGRQFHGVLEGTTGSLPGEVVFQTGMTGYQEVVTDPSYRGQIVTFTAPHIGNTGMNRFDAEAPLPALAGIIVRSLSVRSSSWRSEESLPAYLERHRIPCLAEVDTRALTRHLRKAGSLRGAIAPASTAPASLLHEVRTAPGLTGRNLVREVAPVVGGDGFDPLPARSEAAALALALAEEFPLVTRNEADPGAGKKITVVHCGMKQGIDDALRRRGARVRMVPPDASAEDLLQGAPDGLVLSNGPGDPGALVELIGSVRDVVGKVPMLGICLGHQVLALALGGRTYKMKHGHHGINHPVQDLESGRVLVTSQNHGFAVDDQSLAVPTGGDVTSPVTATHVSLNDGVLEGFTVPDLGVRAVQFHPEANAGPRDARYLFDGFPNRDGMSKADRGTTPALGSEEGA